MRLRIDGTASDPRAVGRWACPRHRLGIRRSFNLRDVFRIHRFRTPERCDQRDAILVGVLTKIGILPEQIIRYLIISPADVLFSIVAGVQPCLWLAHAAELI